MKKHIISLFGRGRWIKIAALHITNRQRLSELIVLVSEYVQRHGLQKLYSHITLLGQYVGDVATRRYTHYNTRALLLVVAALIYLITPIDLLPDLLAGGLIDDISIILYIIKSVEKELRTYRAYLDNQCDAKCEL